MALISPLKRLNIDNKRLFATMKETMDPTRGFYAEISYLYLLIINACNVMKIGHYE